MNKFTELAQPFPVKAVKWRLGATNQKKIAKETGNQWAKPTKGQPLCYVDARMVMDRLDRVLGPENWQDNYSETPKRIICNLGIRVDDEWIWKSDGAGDTDMEGEKGGMSDAFKRAAVKFGIGRYLYSIHVGWIDLENGYIPKVWYSKARELLPQPEMPKSRAEEISNLLDAADPETGEGVDAFAEAWQEMEQEEQAQFGPWVTRLYPGGVSATKQKMRDVLAAYRQRLNGEAA